MSINSQNLQQPKPQEDWEYCKSISQELKNKNVNAGFNLLLQSYFHGKILDIQIYNSIFQALQDDNLPLGYGQVLYLIYRQHFPPHSLMLTWMTKLVATQNQKLYDTLKNDFQTINYPFPVKKARKNIQKQQNGIKQVSQQSGRAKKIRASRQSSSQPQKQQHQQPIPKIQFVDSALKPEQIVKLKMEQDFKNLLSEFNNNFGNYDKIRLYNVEINFNDPSEGPEEHQMDFQDQHDEDQMMNPDMGIFGLDIKNIKIGRVEFINDQDDPGLI